MSTKEVGMYALVLMEYTPAIPVRSAHKYLSKRWTDSKVKAKMEDAAGELLSITGSISECCFEFHDS